MNEKIADVMVITVILSLNLWIASDLLGRLVLWVRDR